MAHGKGAALLALALCAAQVAGASEPTCAAALEHVAGVGDAIDAQLLAAVQKEPKSAAAHFKLAQALLEHAASNATDAGSEKEAGEKDAEEKSKEQKSPGISAAVELLWHVLELDTEHDEAKNLLLDAATLWTVGGAKGESKAINHAVDVYENLFALDPEDPTPLYGLATGLQQHGQTDRAIETLEQALELFDADFEALVTMSNLYWAKQKWTECAKYFGKAAAMKPKDAATRAHHGMLLAQAHKTVADLQAAKAELEVALELDPKSEKTKDILQKVEGALAAAASKAAAAGEAKADAAAAAEEEEAALYDDGGLLDADGDADEGGVAM